MSKAPPIDECNVDTSRAIQPARIVWARLWLGFVILISAEVFSGASLKMGLWHPWTLLVTYWLYFTHFFFFTTLSAWTGRTSFLALYLWGVLFGLYESWITKVIWFGYEGNGNLVLGKLGPFGFSELSMVVIFHGLMSFILPLAIACIWFPSLRRMYPELAWFTRDEKWPRVFRFYLVLCFGVIIAMNSRGPLNLIWNLVFAGGVLWVLRRLAGTSFSLVDAREVIVFRRGGFLALSGYLLMLYGVAYFKLRPEVLPSLAIQIGTASLYLIVIVGLWLYRRRSVIQEPVLVERRELSLVNKTVGWILGVGFVLSFFHGSPALFFPVVVGFMFWTPIGIAMLGIALYRGVRERWRNP